MLHDSLRSLEKRDPNPANSARRARFQKSLDLLCAFGLSPSAIEYYQRLGRASRRLPHEVAREIMEATAQHLSERPADPSGTTLRLHPSGGPTGLV
jgi:hypothetical protein